MKQKLSVPKGPERKLRLSVVQTRGGKSETIEGRCPEGEQAEPVTSCWEGVTGKEGAGASPEESTG